MTQVGEGGRGTAYPVSPGSVPPGGSPTGGEVLAERYQLEQHVNTDSAGRQIWRGVDVVLRRPVAVVVRYPGGPAAAQMLQSAVEASRIVHPNLIGVYDAIDEDIRAYVVREWVDGASLRDHIAIGLFDAERALAVAHAVSAAVTAVHSTGMSHGNVHPGTILIGLDGRVVLADAQADGAAPWEEDIRAIGGLLYFSLTGYWPHAEVAGPAQLPDAMRDPSNGLASPRQVRAGVPDFLDNLTMDLLDRRLGVPPAEVLAGEFARLDTEPGPAEAAYYGEPEPAYGQPAREPEVSAGPLRLSADPQAAAGKPAGRKIAAGLAVLLVIGVIGLLVGLNFLTGGSPSETPPEAGPGTGTPGDPATPSPDGGPIELSPGQLRIIDPDGDGAERDGVEALVDGNPDTSWRTDNYNSAAFGGLKPGMGVLIDLGEPRQLTLLRVDLATAAPAELRVGDSDPGPSEQGHQEVFETYTTIGGPERGSTVVFSSFDPDTTYQYVLVWFSELPPEGNGFRLEVLQVTVEGF